MQLLIKNNSCMKLLLYWIVICCHFFSSCASSGNSPITGVWHGEDVHNNQTDNYTFTIKETRNGTFTGLIEMKMDGALLPRMEINKIEYSLPNFIFTINNGSLTITYSGSMSDDFDQLLGSFEYSNPELPKKQLILKREFPFEPVSNDYSYRKPSDGAFPTASVDEEKIDRKSIVNLLRKIGQGEFGEINSFLVIKNGKLVVEYYYNGFDRDKLNQLQSCTKSVTSILIGIAIDKGYIKSVNDKVISYFPNIECADGWENVTIRHLLTMSSGIEWLRDDSNSPWDKDEGTIAVFQKPIVGRTGTEFNYNSAMQILGALLENATGMKFEKFAKQFLFEPLEIDKYEWQKSLIDSIPLCTGSLKLRPVDMAKIGLLVLNKGMFDGTQVVTEKWILESTSQHIEVPKNRGDNYGYLWWVKTRTPKYIYAHGLGSQFIFVVPGLNMVVVTAGNNFYNKKDTGPFKMLEKYLLNH